MTLEVLPGELAICRLPADAATPDWADSKPFFSITRTPDELSIVTAEKAVPNDLEAERDWRAFRVAGKLEFNMTGVLTALTAPLARAGISIFAVSTFDTDYLLVKQAMLPAALEALAVHGHAVRVLD